ncbi:hypothetical protein AGOR_G00073410 [Albula goreensis]|uniref:C2H2-type domain-containing protein n=1 Tax=Albula goreensis TaxID=1534307 RepID=A0A8T3DQM9_9TELE|nr:hypothetical protein AGOR_G00073410 [Albula goreensis]
MEEDEPRECESEALPCPDQIDSLSLIISAEEEQTQRHSDSALHSADGAVNGHGTDGGEEVVATPLCSPGTSYWSVTEGPHSPFLLSPVPGPPAQRKQAQPRSERASRPGLSRIPGRDHRRYYHEYWRSEYLMDFDPRRHGMICMVCGSSLATLKLSTIKRHIRQKHPDSLLWSAADKEVIRSGWESHLSLESGQRPYCTSGRAASGHEEVLDCARRSAGKPSPATPKRQPSLVNNTDGALTTSSSLLGATALTLERYLNDSLHAWFRQEFLMEYEAGLGRLICMVCGSQLPSLHLDHIKRHVLDVHPNSLVYSAEEKHCILQTWAKRQESDPLRSDVPVKCEHSNGDVGSERDGFLIHDTDHNETGKCRESCIGTELGGEAHNWGHRQHGPSLNRSPRTTFPQRWRLDYLVAHALLGPGLCCMVCSEALGTAKVSNFRKHIQECHPETANLSHSERQALADAWDQQVALPSGDKAMQKLEEAAPNIPDSLAMPVKMGKIASSAKPTEQSRDKKEEGGSRQDMAKEGVSTPTTGRHGHYPGKDQRRNYQVRWRMEYLMDYDCRRHGLICMVCGAALATLKVSTIKRHIQQVHPDSLVYGPAERQQALLSYNQTALHFVHSEDCFSTTDHVHAGHLGHVGLFVS